MRALSCTQSVSCTSCQHVKVVSGDQSPASLVLHPVCLKSQTVCLEVKKLCVESCDTFSALTPSVHQDVKHRCIIFSIKFLVCNPVLHTTVGTIAGPLQIPAALLCMQADHVL